MPLWEFNELDWSGFKIVRFVQKVLARGITTQHYRNKYRDIEYDVYFWRAIIEGYRIQFWKYSFPKYKFTSRNSRGNREDMILRAQRQIDIFLGQPKRTVMAMRFAWDHMEDLERIEDVRLMKAGLYERRYWEPPPGYKDE